MASARRRLDAELVRRKLSSSRDAAQRAILDRQVTVNGALANKAARMVLGGDAIEILGPRPKYVGRGGDKLEAALTSFDIDPSNWHCVDVGSSTGGFTDCLLQHGATDVVAIDVGRAQLHNRLRRHPQVDVREQTDVRTVNPIEIGAPFDLVVIDVSFIGLDRILDIIATLVGPTGEVLALVKPQFEAGRSEANRARGVIKDPEIWRRVLHETVKATQQRGLHVMDVIVSPITGAAGNVEFFLWIGGIERVATTSVDSDAIEAAVQQAMTLASAG